MSQSSGRRDDHVLDLGHVAPGRCYGLLEGADLPPDQPRNWPTSAATCCGYWNKQACASRAEDGVQTFMVRDGEIVLQTCTTPRRRRARRAAGGATSRALGGVLELRDRDTAMVEITAPKPGPAARIIFVPPRRPGVPRRPTVIRHTCFSSFPPGRP